MQREQPDARGRDGKAMTAGIYPFRPDAGEDETDRLLIVDIRAGNADSLERLVRRHQPFLHNLSVRMLYSPADAEDATQEIWIKVVTKLDGFEWRSSFRTWLYRVAVHHLLNRQRGRMEPVSLSFAEYGRGLDQTPELDLPDPKQVPVDLKLLVAEARLGCTMGMLLCLEREQRLVYVLGEIFGASDVVAAEVMGIGRDAFRQRLSRARRDLHQFMNGQCGLVNRANPCRCERKTRGFMRAGYVDPDNLLFARERVTEMRAVAERAQFAMSEQADACSDIYAAHPFYEPKDLARALRQLLAQPELRATFES